MSLKYEPVSEPLGMMGRRRGRSGRVQEEQEVQRFRGGLVFKAHRPVYHSTLGLRVMKKKKRSRR